MAATKSWINQWLSQNACEHDCATHLAEAAIDCLELPEEWLQDETHWIWDSAMLAWCYHKGIELSD